MKREAAAAFVTLCLLTGCKERGRPDPNVQMAPSHQRQESPPTETGSTATTGTSSKMPPVPARLEVPVEVVKAFSGLKLKWKDNSIGQEGTLEVPMGKAVPIPGSDLSVRADAYLPAFTMTAEVITSTGVEEQNPASRITVIEKGKEIFTGWIFNRFPDVHPFQHPRFALFLEGGIPRKSS
jgi:hypothetical protein